MDPSSIHMISLRNIHTDTVSTTSLALLSTAYYSTDTKTTKDLPLPGELSRSHSCSITIGELRSKSLYASNERCFGLFGAELNIMDREALLAIVVDCVGNDRISVLRDALKQSREVN